MVGFQQIWVCYKKLNKIYIIQDINIKLICKLCHMMINRSCKFQGCNSINTAMITDFDVPVLSVTAGSLLQVVIIVNNVSVMCAIYLHLIAHYFLQQSIHVPVSAKVYKLQHTGTMKLTIQKECRRCRQKEKVVICLFLLSSDILSSILQPISAHVPSSPYWWRAEWLYSWEKEERDQYMDRGYYKVH